MEKFRIRFLCKQIIINRSFLVSRGYKSMVYSPEITYYRRIKEKLLTYGEDRKIPV